MKCLTLTQPYATLIMLGKKRIETRSWATSHRGPLAIHAAKGMGPVGGIRGLIDLLGKPDFQRALVPNAHGGEYWNTVVNAAHILPRGAIVAVCDLVGIVPVTSIHRRTLNDWPLTDQERAFGDYTPGRYAWLLADVRALPEPIPCRGALGLWNYEGEL